jgi:hypothetical protein
LDDRFHVMSMEASDTVAYYTDATIPESVFAKLSTMLLVGPFSLPNSNITYCVLFREYGEASITASMAIQPYSDTPDTEHFGLSLHPVQATNHLHLESVLERLNNLIPTYDALCPMYKV